MSIKIQAKKVIVRGNQLWKITHIKMLRQTQLPVKYVGGATECVYLSPDSNSIVYHSNLASKADFKFLTVHSLISNQTLQEKLSIITRCGNILKQVNKDLSKVNEGWKGEETVTI